MITSRQMAESGQLLVCQGGEVITLAELMSRELGHEVRWEEAEAYAKKVRFMARIRELSKARSNL